MQRRERVALQARGIRRGETGRTRVMYTRRERGRGRREGEKKKERRTPEEKERRY